MRRTLTAVIATILVVGCATPDDSPEVPDPVAEALAISDEYVAGYYDEYPEDAWVQRLQAIDG